MSNLPGALGGQTGWSRHFFDPIPTGDRGELRTLRDAGVYILALPPAEAEREFRAASWATELNDRDAAGVSRVRFSCGLPDPLA